MSLTNSLSSPSAPIGDPQVITSWAPDYNPRGRHLLLLHSAPQRGFVVFHPFGLCEGEGGFPLGAFGRFCREPYHTASF